MARRVRYKERMVETPELNITSFLNLMVVLIPFLLISAVFSRVTIQELRIPTSAGGAEIVNQNFAIEVIVRESGMEIANGTAVEAAIPNKEDKYDIELLAKLLLRLKAQYPEKEDATILLEPDIEYDNLIQIMDTVRGTEEKMEETNEVKKIILFPEVSIGDAP